MSTEEQLLQAAAQEINDLRSKNQLMSARLEVFDNLMRVFHTNPNYGNGGLQHPDIVYQINKHLDAKKNPA